MTYPATLDVDSPETIENWRPLVQWLLAIPHFIVLWLLGIVGAAVAIVSWFTILFTGELPLALANTQAMVLRYQARATAYAGFLHADYPPFDFTSAVEEPGGTPVSVSFSPQLQNRDRLSVGLRILYAIPAAIFAGIIVVAAQVVWIVALFAVLFTGKWPESIREFVVKALRVGMRVNAYGTLLTDEYPPFSLEG